MVSPEHDNLEADLSAYLDGELEPPRARAVERLLAESEDARQTLADLRQVRDQLAALPRLRAPAKLADTLAKQGGGAPGRPVPAARRLRTLRLFTQITAAAAVLAAGVFVGYRYLQPQPSALSEPAPSPPLARSERMLKKAPPLATVREDKAQEIAAEADAAAPKDAGAFAAGEPADQLTSPGYAAAPAVPRAPAGAPPEAPLAALQEEPVSAASIDLLIETQHEANYAANAAVLASWMGPDAAEREPSVAANQPIERVYHLQAPELASRLSELLGVNPHGRVELQQGQAAADSSALTEVAEALGAHRDGSRGAAGASPIMRAAKADREETRDHGARSSVGKGGGRLGAEPAKKSLPAPAGRGDESLPERVHQRHRAVTEEPNLTIILVDPPASQPLAEQRSAASQPGMNAGLLVEQTAKEALLDQLLGLVIKGGPGAGKPESMPQPGSAPITLRVRLMPPPTATAPASQAAPPAP